MFLINAGRAQCVACLLLIALGERTLMKELG